MGELNNYETGIEDQLPLKSFALVTDSLVKDALKNSIGSDAELLSFDVIPFTNKGDNYSSVVAGVEVKYNKNGTEFEESFVAKLNPLRQESAFTEILERLYAREPVVLSTVIGGMNKELEKLKLDKIKTAKLFSQNLEKGREAFLMENLREEGFKMYDRKKGMDINHALLVLKELGRFHASSILYEEAIYPKNLLENFETLGTTFVDRNHDSFETICKMFSTQGENARKFLQNAGPKYERCVQWLTKHSHEMVEFYDEVYSSQEPFLVFIHADCWTNNMLFRYNEDGIPVDIRFVDLQGASKASPAADLNYFFYTSLNGDFRLKNINTLVTAYYESFSDVLRRAGKEPPFTYLELKEELNNRKRFGLTSALMALPIILAEGDEIWDIESLKPDELDQYSETQSKKFEKMSQRDGPFKDRFLALFDELIGTHVFDDK